MDNLKLIKKIKIGIIGAGGGGTNAVANNAHKFAPFNIDFLAINTDEQALMKHASRKETSKFFQRKLIGKNLTSGLGAGGNPSIGWSAAHEDRNFLEKWLSDKKIVFIATGMGGGSGTGSGPYCARLSTMMGCLTIGISTLPFEFEGRERMQSALIGLKTMEKYADLSIVINNNLLFKKHASSTIETSFASADKLLGDGIITILNLILEDAYINVDFADISRIVKNSRNGFISIGFAKGLNGNGLEENQSKLEAGVNRLLDTTIVTSETKTATKALLSITGSKDVLRMEYVRYVVNSILEKVNQDLNIIFGLTINDTMVNTLKVSLILTGMDSLSLLENVEDIEGKYFNSDSEEEE